MPTLQQLLAAARAITARRGAIPHLSTLDGATWKCGALDADSGELAAELPTGCAATPEGAVATFLEALHAEQLAALEPRAVALRSLRDAYPAGVTVTAPELAAEVA